MKQKSLIDEILDATIKKPAAGVIISIFFFCLGSYLTHNRAHISAKPNEMIFLPVMHQLGMISHVLSVLFLILAGIGYIVTFGKRNNRAKNPKVSLPRRTKVLDLGQKRNISGGKRV